MPVAIVGGGCSGLLVAVHLIRSGFAGEITIVEPRPNLGGGLAYSTSFEQHLLNVPAGKMSAFSREPDHFLDWLRARHWPDAVFNTFAPRMYFGEYLREIFREAGQCKHIQAEAMAIEDGRLKLSNGALLPAEKIVLALGNPDSSAAPAMRKGLEDRWHLSPWFDDALKVRYPGERILIVGTGPTAVDSALALLGQKSPATVYMVSRRGFLPQVHNLQIAPAPLPALRHRGNIRLLCRELRAHIEEAAESGIDWRATIDALRPVSNEIWQELPVADRRTFLRHIRPYWEPHRSRMPPETSAQIDKHRANGSLRILAGQLKEVSARKVLIRLRQGGEATLEADRIISCTGTHEDYTRTPRPLVRSLFAAGLARGNDAGIGFSTGANGALLNKDLQPSRLLFTLGTPRRGDLIETTAVPEIREQAEALAAHLAGTILRPEAMDR
jgi:uncharacterized NAD(P)/FAD-binding protein YdhS